MSVSMNFLLIHAMSKVPHYQNKHMTMTQTGDAFAQLPLLSKKEVIQSPNDFLANDYLLFPKKERMVIRRSAGASGKPLKVHWDAREEEASLAAVSRLRQKWYGITPEDSFCYFFTTEYHQNSLVYEVRSTVRDEDGQCLGFAKRNLTAERLLDIHKEMFAFDPVWLILSPHIALLLAETIKNNDLPSLPRLQYVELTGESLCESARAALTEVFDCPIGNRYAATETGGIALACPEGHFHILEDNVLVEIFRKGGSSVPDGTEGDIVLTSYLNRAMPLLRYQIGDKGYITRETCACGHTAPTLHLTAARSNDFITLPSGGRVVADVFLYAIEYINERIGPIIRQFTIRQTGITPLSFNVRLVLHSLYKDWKDTIQELFVKNIYESALQDAVFSFAFDEKLFADSPRQPLGYFRNEAKEDVTHG